MNVFLKLKLIVCSLLAEMSNADDIPFFLDALPRGFLPLPDFDLFVVFCFTLESEIYNAGSLEVFGVPYMQPFAFANPATRYGQAVLGYPGGPGWPGISSSTI